MSVIVKGAKGGGRGVCLLVHFISLRNKISLLGSFFHPLLDISDLSFILPLLNTCNERNQAQICENTLKF